MKPALRGRCSVAVAAKMTAGKIIITAKVNKRVKVGH